MKVVYSNSMKKNLENEKKIKRTYGKLYESISQVLSVLLIVENLEMVPNVPPTRRHKLEGNYRGMFGIDLNKNYRMIIRPLNEEEDLKKINSIEIVDIVDYH